MSSCLNKLGLPNAIPKPLIPKMLKAGFVFFHSPRVLRAYLASCQVTGLILGILDDHVKLFKSRNFVSVTPTIQEPLPGWVDSLNGPVGVLVGAGKGVIRSMLCHPDNRAEVIPVDIAINAIIAATWRRATTK